MAAEILTEQMPERECPGEKTLLLFEIPSYILATSATGMQPSKRRRRIVFKP
jgi:hypothetical protein